MSLRRAYLDHAEAMPVGHRICIDGRAFREAFGRQLTSFHPLAPERAGPESDFLSGCIGSAYGRIRCRYDAFNDTYEVSKHEEQELRDGARFHVDFDREHFYQKRPDGMWEPRVKNPTNSA